MSSDNYLGRLKKFWFPDRRSLLWFLLGLPALHFFQTLIHEGSHALAALIATGSFPQFAPFPHASPQVAFRNGVTFSGEGFIQAPQFVALGLIVLLTFLFIRVRGPTARLFLRLWLLGASLDLLYNTRTELFSGHNEFADWSRFQDQCAIGDAGMIGLSALMWLFPLSHLFWLNLPPWRCDEPRNSSSLDYRPVAIAFGLLSFSAILCSVVISDPKIIKSTSAFILPFVVQVLILSWCALYLGFSVVRGQRAKLKRKRTLTQ